MMGIGKMASSKKASVPIQMENSMMESGSKESLMGLESKHGLMDANMMECGIWGNRQARARKYILMAERRRAIGKMVYLSKEVSKY